MIGSTMRVCFFLLVSLACTPLFAKSWVRYSLPQLVLEADAIVFTTDMKVETILDPQHERFPYTRVTARVTQVLAGDLKIDHEVVASAGPTSLGRHRARMPWQLMFLREHHGSWKIFGAEMNGVWTERHTDGREVERKTLQETVRKLIRFKSGDETKRVEVLGELLRSDQEFHFQVGLHAALACWSKDPDDPLVTHVTPYALEKLNAEAVHTFGELERWCVPFLRFAPEATALPEWLKVMERRYAIVGAKETAYSLFHLYAHKTRPGDTWPVWSDDPDGNLRRARTWLRENKPRLLRECVEEYVTRLESKTIRDRRIGLAWLQAAVESPVEFDPEGTPADRARQLSKIRAWLKKQSTPTTTRPNRQ